METLKQIYYDFISSKEYFALSRMSEVEDAEKKILNCFEKYMICGEAFYAERASFEIEELINENSLYNEMQGFTYGFRYAMRLASESFLND